MSWPSHRFPAAILAVLAACSLLTAIRTVSAEESPLPYERLRGDIEAFTGGGNFRSSNWGATPDEVQQQEQAEAQGREDLEEGAFSLLYIEQILGRTGEIRYFFDGKCGRLVGGSITFAEPVSELGYLSILQTINNIHGEGGPISELTNGGSYSTWRHGESFIALLHQPYGNDVRLEYGLEAPALMEKPPTSIFYRMEGERPANCDYSKD